MKTTRSTKYVGSYNLSYGKRYTASKTVWYRVFIKILNGEIGESFFFSSILSTFSPTLTFLFLQLLLSPLICSLPVPKIPYFFFNQQWKTLILQIHPQEKKHQQKDHHFHRWTTIHQFNPLQHLLCSLRSQLFKSRASNVPKASTKHQERASSTAALNHAFAK